MARRRLATRAEAVAALGLTSPRALDRLVEKGAPKPKPGSRGTARYDVPAIQAWQAARGTRSQPTLDLATERARWTRIQADQSMLKLQATRGELVAVVDAQRVLRGLIVATKTQLLSVPHRAAQAGLPREHQALVRRLITEALRELLTGTLQELEADRRGEHEDVA